MPVDPFCVDKMADVDDDALYMTSRSALTFGASKSRMKVSVPPAAQTLVTMLTQRLHDEE